MDIVELLRKTAENLRKEAERIRETPMKKQASYRIDVREIRRLIREGR